MRIVSVNVGEPREIQWRRQSVLTGIFKYPVNGRVALRSLNLEGDGQADFSVHGGVDKAVYAYPSEHYGYWRGELPDAELEWGAFGENLTVEGLSEREVRVGDRFRMGDAELVVTQPRLPCFKLGIRFGRDDMVKRFLASMRTGFYLAVEREGSVAAGDSVELLQREENAITIHDLARVYASDRDDVDALRRALASERLSAQWKAVFRERLAKANL